MVLRLFFFAVARSHPLARATPLFHCGLQLSPSATAAAAVEVLRDMKPQSCEDR